MAAETDGRARGGAPALLALALLGAFASAIRYAPVIDEPWDRSVESSSSAVYFGRAEQYFQRLGFREVRGAPYFYRMPVVEGVADDKAHGRYLRHPPLAFWLVHLSVEIGGWSERAFRLVPIVFSSLTGALIAWLIGRYAGLGFGLAGLALYLTLPMSWAVGWMVSYEPCAIAMMLAAFVAHVRLRDAPVRAYSVVWGLVLLAGLFDWSGLFAVAAIFVHELLAPAGRRRLHRAFGLAVPALLAVVAFAACGALWRGSLTGGVTLIWENARHAALHEARKGTAGEWLANQWKFWRELYTLPLTLVVLAALPLLVARCRSAIDPLPRCALALLAPALLHVLAFRDHSFDHEFWWCYAIPFAVLAAVVLIREVAARSRFSFGHPAVLAGILVFLLAWGGIDRIRARHEAFRTTEFRDLGTELNRFAGPRDALLWVGRFETESFYLKPWYVDVVGSASLESYRGMRDLKRGGKLLVERVVAVVPDGTAVDFTPENLPALRELGSVRRIEPPDVVALAPTLAGRYPGRGLWVLTIE